MSVITYEEREKRACRGQQNHEPGHVAGGRKNSGDGGILAETEQRHQRNHAHKNGRGREKN